MDIDKLEKSLTPEVRQKGLEQIKTSISDSSDSFVVLNLTGDEIYNLETTFPGAFVVDQLITEFVAEFTADYHLIQPKYDIIFCAHAMPLVEAGVVPKTIRAMACALKDKGELWLITPSFEWAAAQVSQAKPSPVMFPMLFGHANRSAYTLAWLRALVEEAGLIPRKCYQGTYALHLGDKEYTILQNVVIGARWLPLPGF